jgi:hypothetical protein
MSVSKINFALPNFTYLQTARVRVVGPTGLCKLARCVLDSGSQTSFVSTSIIDSLKLDVIDQQNLAVSAFELSCYVTLEETSAHRLKRDLDQLQHDHHRI